MSPELERLVKLQEIETRAAEAERRIAEAPREIAALDATLDAARQAVAAARQAVADNQTARRSLDKDLLSAQQRLSKYKEQLMAVKTNTEYHAMQHQISAVEGEVGNVEEQILLNMMEADERNARLKTAEAALKSAETAVAKERSAIEADAGEKRHLLEQSARDRQTLLPSIDTNVLQLFQRLLKGRAGIAVAQAADGHCSICHVRLRPQVFNTIMRNEAIIQCDSCQRILYFAGPRERSAAGQAAVDNAHARQAAHERPSS
jgi:predicted  nucleic acid-binding Zn-ribbon protein